MGKQDPRRTGFLTGLADILDPQRLQRFLAEDEVDFEDDPEHDAVTVDDWIYELIDIKEAHSRQIAKKGNKLRCSFAAVGFDNSGEIWGRCQAPTGIYNVSLSGGLFDDQ